ncbi:MAG: type I methionyl aminopeptidase [Chloroflexota bacterium]
MSMFKRKKRKFLQKKRTRNTNERLAPVYKTPQEIKIMRESGRIVARVHAALRKAIEPGVSTWDLDQIALKTLSKYNATSSFKGYRGFPAHICTSVNDELVHGIPKKSRKLNAGDIISIDVGACYRGFIGDSAWSYAVGDIHTDAIELMNVTEQSLFKGIEQASSGNRIADISRAVQSHVEQNGFYIVREYTGHGVGRDMHEAPQVLNYVSDDLDGSLELRAGLVLAIEPMVQDVTNETITLRDKWTVINKKRGLAAHFEHTVAITNNGPEILTIP